MLNSLSKIVFTFRYLFNDLMSIPLTTGGISTFPVWWWENLINHRHSAGTRHPRRILLIPSAKLLKIILLSLLKSVRKVFRYSIPCCDSSLWTFGVEPGIILYISVNIDTYSHEQLLDISVVMETKNYELQGEFGTHECSIPNSFPVL